MVGHFLLYIAHGVHRDSKETPEVQWVTSRHLTCRKAGVPHVKHSYEVYSSQHFVTAESLALAWYEGPPGGSVLEQDCF